MSKDGVDNRDVQSGTFDPVTKEGRPQPHQVKDKMSAHEQAQWGADVRAEAVPGNEPVLPEGLVRPPAGPLNPRTGRRETK